jgi:hypothetical protein
MQVTLNIPDGKMAFFMELVKNLGFIKMESTTANSGLTKRQRELVDIEVQKAEDDPDYMLDFETAWKTLKTEQ